MLKVRKHGWKNQVWRGMELGFGDTWAETSYLLRVSEELGQPVRVFSRNMEFIGRVKAIVSVLRTTGKIHFVHESPQVKMQYCQPYRTKFVPTKRIWAEDRSSNIIAYQFDGHHLSHQKNLPRHRIQYLINSLRKMGFNPVDVGHKKPLSFIVDVLSSCKLFIGCPSGLSVVSMSVGNPIMLITRMLPKPFLNFLSSCQYSTRQDVHMFSSVTDFLSVMETRLVKML